MAYSTIAYPFFHPRIAALLISPSLDQRPVYRTLKSRLETLVDSEWRQGALLFRMGDFDSYLTVKTPSKNALQALIHMAIASV